MHTKNISELTAYLDKGGLPWWLEPPDPSVYLRAPYLVFDFETMNLDKGFAGNPLNDVVSAAWYKSGDREVQYHRGGMLDQDKLLDDIRVVLATKGFLVAHNAKFDIQWLARMGVPMERIFVYDTMIGEFVLAGNRRVKLDLGSVAVRYNMGEKASYVDQLMKGGVCPSEMPPKYLRARAIRDVKQTLGIFLEQRQALACEGKLPIQFTRCIFTPVLADMEMQGLCVDQTRTYQEHSTATMELGIARAEFNTLFGEVNTRSTQQMAKMIYGTLGFKELQGYRGKAIRNKPSKAFPGGAPKVDTKTLEKLVVTTDAQREFIRLRKEIGKKDAALTKALDFFKGIVDEYEGIFYGQLNQCIAQTHRLTSSGRRRFMAYLEKELGIQMQNMPGAYKDLIKPKREGYKIADADGSQLEFRVAAFLGQDTQAIYNIRHDVDQHRLTALVINNLTTTAWDALSKAKKKSLRGGAKAHTFKPLYGGTRGTESEMEYYQWFRDEYYELAAVQKGWTETVLDKGYLKLPWGMIFYWPTCRQNDRTGYIDFTPSIYNYPVQSLATAEIIPIALTYMWYRAKQNDDRIKLINTIHDSGTAEIPAGTEELWKALAAQCFSLDVYGYLKEVYELDFNVPLGVGVSIGERWESPDSEEWEINVEQDGEYWVKGDREE
jgi:DNA polymerase I-like protein with 3'-5' exonuclease and polymerase domains